MLRASHINHHWRRFAHSCLSVVAVLVLTPNAGAWESKVSKVCRLSLTHAVRNISRNSDFQLSQLKHLIQDLPPKTQHLFSAALANDGTVLTTVDKSALTNFAKKTLARLNKNQREVLYHLLKWDEALVKSAETTASSSRNKLMLTRGAAGVATLYYGPGLIVSGGKFVIGLAAYANSLMDYAEAIEEEKKEKEETRKESFGELYNEDPSYFAEELKISKGLNELPEKVWLKDVGFKKTATYEEPDGTRIVEYKVISGDTKIKNLLVVENVVKNVHEGFVVAFASEKDNNLMILQYDSNAVATPYFTRGQELEFEGSKSPKIFFEHSEVVIEEIPLEAGNLAAYLEKVPSPTKSPFISRPESSFDEKYKDHIQKNTFVAVIDTGIDYSRQDLLAASAVNEKEVYGDGIDNDKNGYVDDYLGYNANLNNGAAHSWPSNYHGSNVSEVIAKGSKHVQILPIKVQFELSEQTFSQHQRAIDYIRNWNKNNPDKLIRVVNMSFGSSEPKASDHWRRLIKENPDLIFVAGAGNDNEGEKDLHFYPASFKLPNIISVGGIDQEGKLIDTFGEGPNVDYAGLARDVSVMDTNRNAIKVSGTSYSTPYISLVISEILTLRPKLNITQIKEILDSSVELTTPRLNTRTGGIINRDKAYEKALTYPE